MFTPSVVLSCVGCGEEEEFGAWRGGELSMSIGSGAGVIGGGKEGWLSSLISIVGGGGMECHSSVTVRESRSIKTVLDIREDTLESRFGVTSIYVRHAVRKKIKAN